MDSADRGRFISLEGGEGAGKSTQVRLLCAKLREAGCIVAQTREPGGTPGAEAIRDLLVTGDGDRWDAMTEALLHFAARRDHVEKLIRPALDAGDWVVSDRFADSTMAYQGYAQRLGKETVDELGHLAIQDFKPDLTIILDLSPEDGLARVDERHAGKTEGVVEDRYERMGHDFHKCLRDAFLDIARREPDRCVVVDARGTPEAVASSIWEQVTRRFAKELRIAA